MAGLEEGSSFEVFSGFEMWGGVRGCITEAIAMRAILTSTGAFPEHICHNPRTAFPNFETAERNGPSRAWFRRGRDYEYLNNSSISMFVLQWMCMAHNSSSKPNRSQVPPPHATTLVSLTYPQPTYVNAFLSEFIQLPLLRTYTPILQA